MMNIMFTTRFYITDACNSQGCGVRVGVAELESVKTYQL
jgi:hypothetical protein